MSVELVINRNQMSSIRHHVSSHVNSALMMKFNHMAPNPLLSARIPLDLNERLEVRSRETGKDKTQLVIEALRAYLNAPAEPSTEEKLARLEERLAMLEATVAQLVQQREA